MSINDYVHIARTQLAATTDHFHEYPQSDLYLFFPLIGELFSIRVQCTLQASWYLTDMSSLFISFSSISMWQTIWTNQINTWIKSHYLALQARHRHPQANKMRSIEKALHQEVIKTGSCCQISRKWSKVLCNRLEFSNLIFLVNHSGIKIKTRKVKSSWKAFAKSFCLEMRWIFSRQPLHLESM